MRKWLVVLFAVAMLCGSAEANIGFEGWGIRGGLSVDPDQFDVGAHLNLGEFMHNWRFQPNLELGFGDDVFLLLINGESFYLFDIAGSNFKPYVGGELSLVYWRVDHPRGDTDDLELGLSPVGGLEFPFSKRLMGFLEIKFGFGDVPDFRATVGIHL